MRAIKRARVIGVAAGRHESFVRKLGADEFIDYTTTKPESQVHDLDLVVDAVGGPTTGRFLTTLKRGGGLFPVFPLGFIGTDEAKHLGVTVSSVQVRSNGAQLAQLAALLDAKIIQVNVDSTFQLSDARSAHERAARGGMQGKIVLTTGWRT